MKANNIIVRHLQRAQRTYTIGGSASWIIFAAPYLIVGVFFFLISWAPTQDFAALLTFPNYPIEWVTFVVCLLAGLFSVRLALRLRSTRQRPLVWMFYIVFGVGLLWTAGEVSAWGQQVLGYRTPHW